MSNVPDHLLQPLARVVERALEQAPELSSEQIMLVGAWCRDTMHAALGHDFATSATRDIDLALALTGWGTFELLSAAFPRVGDTRIRFAIAGHHVDLLPFGDLEDPRGFVAVPNRGETISVWGFDEIYSRSMPLPLTPTLAIQMPTVPGYAAAKLVSWLDRSSWRETRDANDLALIAYWYAESPDVRGRLYDTTEGQHVLLDEELDLPRAATRLLGKDVSAIVGPQRITELRERWPGDLDFLSRNFTISTLSEWLGQENRRREIIDALSRGLLDLT